MSATQIGEDALSAGIAQAISEHDWEGVKAFLYLLTLTDPARAQQVLDAIDAGLTIAEAVAR